ncbi:MAG: sugar phosphate isomerase/epimerase [Oscillospiraceae bacterium]|nr:sugar phosphate isomerase/epimerase [Oscillospiraceae bacterium]
MLISTQTHTFAVKFGEHEAIKLLAGVGFDSLDYSMFGILDKNNPLFKDDYRQYAKSLKKTADENNIAFNQSHAPFPSYIQYPTKEQADRGHNETIAPAIARAMEVTSILGGKIVVVHPITLSNCGYREQKKFNMDFYGDLLAYCKKYNVKVALENMWGWDETARKVTPGACARADEFADYLDSLDKDYFTACLDLGHCEMQGSGSGSAAELINSLGHERLKALHIHDNDKISDLHTLPFTQKMNWDEIMQSLKNINYDGELTFEADNFISKFPPALYPEASSLMLKVGRYFAEKYEL